MTLNLLEGYDVASLGPGSLPFLHRYTEAMKLACADREGFFGDPHQVDVPIRGLLDKAYAEERRKLIRDDRAWPELPLPGDPWRHEGRTGPAGYVPRIAEGVGAPDTSYVAAMDSEGNAFSATPSDPGLGAPLVPGLGIIVSTRGAQLWTTPGHPSAIAPRKRPRLTPNPALLMRDGAALMPFGCPGEDAQLPEQLLADTAAEPWRRGARRVRPHVGRPRWPGVVRPLDRRPRRSTRRLRACPRRGSGRGRARARRVRGVGDDRVVVRLHEAQQGRRLRPRFPDGRAHLAGAREGRRRRRVRPQSRPHDRSARALRARHRRPDRARLHWTRLLHE